MDAPSYTLQELAEASGVEARTIRSYIERDLLPGPSSLGRSASYGRDHLDRLVVIRKLRDARRDLTLDKIRALLAQLTPDQIAAIASGSSSIESLLASEAPQLTSALDYLKGLATLAPKPESAPRAPGATAASPAAAPAASPRTRTPLEELLAQLEKLTARQNVARESRGATWHRISITPDLELSVRGELDADQLAALHRVGDHLRHLLTKGAPA